MKQTRRSPVLMSLVASLVVVVIYTFSSQFPFFELPKLKTQDLLFKVRKSIVKTSPALKDVFLITIDDESIEKVGEKWPFRRRLYANLLKKINKANPRVIGLDLIFSGKSDPLDDALLEEAIKTSGKVVLASYVSPSKDYILSMGGFNQSAKGSGIVNKILDPDNVVRRTRLYYHDAQGKIIAWAWELEILFHLFGWDRENCEVLTRQIFCSDKTNLQKILNVPFYEQADNRINYRYTINDIRHMTLWDAIKRPSFEDELKDKIVLVGSTSGVLHDYYRTPLGMMSGVMVNANTLISLTTNDYMQKIPFIFDSLFVGLFVFLAVLFAGRYDILKSFGFMVITNIGFALFFFLLFYFNRIGDSCMPFLGGWLAFLLVSLYRYFYTRLENVQLQNKVITDPLTGLFNRRVLETKIEDEFEALNNANQLRKTDLVYDLCLMMIDIDNFKKINDQYGHQFGDEALKNVSFALKTNTRKDDMVARFGGEEFCVVLPHTRKKEAVQIAEKIRSQIQNQNYSYVNRLVSFTVSIGLASAKEDCLLNSKALIRAADQALYEAKRTGKNKVVSYNP